MSRINETHLHCAIKLDAKFRFFHLLYHKNSFEKNSKWEIILKYIISLADNIIQSCCKLTQ